MSREGIERSTPLQVRGQDADDCSWIPTLVENLKRNQRNLGLSPDMVRHKSDEFGKLAQHTQTNIPYLPS